MAQNISPLRFLLIGCGGIVNNAQILAFEKHPKRVRLVAACDPSTNARDAIATRLASIGPVVTYADPAEALAQLRDQFDAALVTTPHFLHFRQAAQCIEAGLPVLIEKPACNTLDELRRLIALSQKHKALAVAGQNRRYDLRALWLKNWLKQQPEKFGELRSFDLRGWQNIEAWIATKPDKNTDFWILDKKRAGGGVVISLLVHYLDMIRFLSGHDYIEVSAKGRFDAPFKNGAESSCSALLTLANGAVGTMHANYLSRKSFRPNEVFNLIGEHGYISNEQGWKYATTGGAEPIDQEWQFKGTTDVPNDPSLALDDNMFVAQLLAFAEAVCTRTRPMNHLKDNFNTLATIEALYTSMNQHGTPVRVANF
ncbi:MAG: Gfo/Idh/MocA family oxidoreductase [Cephaloticoccus sp.]|nr:Gfo/Idh/MocA family oxidoreductase [Cephaloticoccus sp.]